MMGMGRAITRTPLMAQHVPISFPSPGDEIDGLAGSIVAYDHNHSDTRLVLIVMLVVVLVIMMVRTIVIVMVKVIVR